MVYKYHLKYTLTKQSKYGRGWFNQKFQMVVLLLFGTCNQYQYLQYVITCQMTCICYLKERAMFYNVYIIKKSSLVLFLLFFDSYKVCKIEDITTMKEYITEIMIPNSWWHVTEHLQIMDCHFCLWFSYFLTNKNKLLLFVKYHTRIHFFVILNIKRLQVFNIRSIKHSKQIDFIS